MNNENIGIIIALEDLISSNGAFLSPFNIDLCEIKCWNPENYSDDNAKKLCTLIDAGSIRVTGLWCGWTGPMKWDLYEGQQLLGLVPSKYRSLRILELKKGIQFAHRVGLNQVTTHVGFIPENPMTEEYSEIVSTVRDLADYASTSGPPGSTLFLSASVLSSLSPLSE